MPTLFISDLHLSGDRPQITELFIDFLRTRARDADALYILGDLFEVWLGDDMVLPDYQAAISAMRELSASGVPLYVMYGNRDFLMQDGFEEMTGCKLLDEEHVMDLYGTPALLMHGDTLCTDDVEYQKFRAMVRNPQWQTELLAKTPQERIELAKKYREVSKTETDNKQLDIMDVNQQAVEQVMQKHNVQRLIHGHTHRPAVHDFTVNSQNAQRIVLADWYEHGSVLVCDARGCQAENLGAD